ncbi:hypothetical protein B0H17DRAFT_1209631 [Mycena rosella]|uniref:Uncharacterized protein n=1 Tax=Mycena rosella TaxID=1033263 RepID=A0AAD7CY52_MYCRO|nr:hypothetical protein B0H17DRAFT_1209631 [Mycena rosella]
MSISFRPMTGPCTGGVAPLNLELGHRMCMGHERLDAIMPPPRVGRHVTRERIGAQVTQYFKDFINLCPPPSSFPVVVLKLIGWNLQSLTEKDGVVYDQATRNEMTQMAKILKGNGTAAPDAPTLGLFAAQGAGLLHRVSVASMRVSVAQMRVNPASMRVNPAPVRASPASLCDGPRYCIEHLFTSS